MKRNMLLSAILVLLISACATATSTPTPGVPPEAATAAAQTAAARQTMDALQTQIAFAPTATATFTPEPTATLRPTATTIPTNTPLPTLVLSPSPTSNSKPCNVVEFITDVTIPDNTNVAPESAFIKTWRVKNVGSCAWSKEYSLVFTAGTSMTTVTTQKLTAAVSPGQEADVSVTLMAPKQVGNWFGMWKLQDAKGEQFGTGANRDKAFWVRIVVGSTTLANPDLTLSYCSAVWKSSTGSVVCPSPTVDYRNGTVTLTDTPMVEIGYKDDETTILVIPSNGSGGFIAGYWPMFKAKAEHHFKALTGCADTMTKCSVTFKLNYILEGDAAEKTLSSWDETYDGNKTAADISLAFAAEKQIQLILRVENKDGSSTDDQAFWLKPRIETIP